MTHKLLDQELTYLFREVLLDLRDLLLPTIGWHHMEEKVPHLLTLLKIKFHLDHHTDLHRGNQQNRRPQQSSSGLAMVRIHLDPCLCQLLTEKISLEGHFFPLLKKVVKGTEPRLPENLWKSLTKKMATE